MSGRPLRLLLATHAFPPASTAGVEVYTLRLARTLVARGHVVKVLTAVHDLSATPGARRTRSWQGIDIDEVVNVHHRGTLEATWRDPDVDAVARAVVGEFRPDVVHLQHLLNLSVGVIAAARAAGARVILTLHDHWLSCPRDGLRMRADLALCPTVDHATCARCLADSPYLVPAAQARLSQAVRSVGLGRYLHRMHARAPALATAVLRALRRTSPGPASLERDLDERAAGLRRALQDVDLVLAPSRFVRDRAEEWGLPAARLRVVPHGIAVQPRAARRRGQEHVVFVGTLAPHKGVHVLLAAFRGLPRPGARLTLHGSERAHPEYGAALRRQAEGDARIHFAGPFPEGEQDRVLGAADVLVLPSVWWENAPLTLLEALAAGVPVVASAIGGIPEVVEGQGILVPPGDVLALRDALARVLAGTTPPPDPGRVRPWEDVVSDLLVLYQEPATPS